MTNKKDIYILWFPLYFKKGRSAKSNLMLTDKKTLRKCPKGTVLKKKKKKGKWKQSHTECMAHILNHCLQQTLYQNLRAHNASALF